MDPTFWATVAATVVAAAAIAVGYRGIREQLRQNSAIAGAQSAIEWRTQVIDLHDRGLTPAQIRRIMFLEDGGEGYEAANGSIEEVLRDIPRRVSGHAAGVLAQGEQASASNG